MTTTPVELTERVLLMAVRRSNNKSILDNDIRSLSFSLSCFLVGTNIAGAST